MAGPIFDGVLSLAEGTDHEQFAMTVLRRALEHGYGLLFGKELLRSLDPAEGATLDRLEAEIARPFTLSITSGLLATDAMRIFESQLNPWRNLDPERADILVFLRELWSLDPIREAFFVIVERTIWSETKMPRRTLSFDQFIRHLVSYYKNSLRKTEVGNVEGIFQVRK
jgi:hypothetical protein